MMFEFLKSKIHFDAVLKIHRNISWKQISLVQVSIAEVSSDKVCNGIHKISDFGVKCKKVHRTC